MFAVTTTTQWFSRSIDFARNFDFSNAVNQSKDFFNFSRRVVVSSIASSFEDAKNLHLQIQRLKNRNFAFGKEEESNCHNISILLDKQETDKQLSE